jgi:RecA/RadA recombinase
MKTKKEHKLTPEEEVNLIENKLGYTTFERPVDSFNYINLGHHDLNEALGHGKYGVRIGSIIELSGWESHGKTLLATVIAAIGQKQDKHLYVAKGDLEYSDNTELNKKMGIDMDRFFLFRAKLAINSKLLKRITKITNKIDKSKSEKEKEKLNELYRKLMAKTEKYQETAQMLCRKIEKWVKYKNSMDPKASFVIIMDSVTGILTEEEGDADLDYNMRTNVSLASFMSKLCKKWVGFAKNYNAVIIFINQIRVAPGVMFGNPEYTTGGKALKFYASVRAKVARVKGGRVKKHGKVIGIRTMVTNQKNKVGPHEQGRAGIRILTRKGRWFPMSADSIIKEAKSEKEKYVTAE